MLIWWTGFYLLCVYYLNAYYTWFIWVCCHPNSVAVYVISFIFTFIKGCINVHSWCTCAALCLCNRLHLALRSTSQWRKRIILLRRCQCHAMPRFQELSLSLPVGGPLLPLQTVAAISVTCKWLKQDWSYRCETAGASSKEPLRLVFGCLASLALDWYD